MDPFVHLHTHTEYSILDGAAKLDDLIKAAIADGQPAISSTDHGNMYGCLEFYKKCQKAGIKYIPGEEFYMAAESVDERPKRGKAKLDDTGGETAEGQKLYYHLTMLAETTEGFQNLIKLSSKAFMEGYYYKPRIDWSMLEDYSKGIIATSGCLGGLVLQSLLRGDIETAQARAGRLQDIFGKENFFIEIQDHGIAAQFQTNPMLVDLAKYLRAPLVATNDSHYVHKDNAIAHDALLCVQTGALMSDENRFHFEGDEHYLKTAAEMRYLFKELPDSCDNTLWIAERSNVVLDYSGYKLPSFPVPQGFVDDKEYLRHLTIEGAKKRWGAPIPSDNLARLEFELDVINNMGFASYFLILWDLVKYAHENDITTGPGRGSAAGSAVSYALNITQLDPIKYDLLFERFLNPSRISMPDIDLDMDSRYRDTLIRYAAQRYGEDRVAQIITFSQIKARAAVRDAARVLGFNYQVGDKVAKAMPPLVMGRDTPLHACIEKDEKHLDGYASATEVRAMYSTDPEVKAVIDVALGLEGLRRGDGIHAAAVVISDKPLTEYLPIQRKGEDKPIVTQYEMNNVEELGLLKMDFLALRNLDIIDSTVKLVKKLRNVDIDINDLPLADEKSFDLLRAGDTLGIFQLESSQMRELLKRLAPTSFHDIAAVVALYRPGPMASNMHNDYADRKNYRQEVSYFHEDAKPILKDTYGLMIYQEQMMRVAQKFAGYSLAEADNLRKACGKKIRELMAKEKEKLIEGIINQGYEAHLANYIWDMIEPFADYSFNKSHAYAYGFIAYQTAYLKANYPLEYMAALLTCTEDPIKTALQLSECSKLGIEVLPPDVNASESNFKPIIGDNKILFGFDSVKNLGNGDAIGIERAENGNFYDFVDFIERTTKHGVNKKSLQALIAGGAFDSFGYNRRTLYEAIEDIQKFVRKKIKDDEKGIMSLFETASPTIQVLDEFPDKERLNLEKESLGVYLTGHPLDSIIHMYDEEDVVKVHDLPDTHGAVVRIIGMITKLKILKTKKGDTMAVFQLEDLHQDIEVILFPKQMKQCMEFIYDDSIVEIEGHMDVRAEFPKFIALQIKGIDTE